MVLNNTIKVILVSVIITTISILSGALNWINQFIVVGSCFFVGGLLYSKKTSVKLIIYSSITLLPFLLIYGGLVFSKRLIHVYPIALISILSFGLGILIIRKATLNSIIFFILLYGGLLVFAGLIGMPNWLAYSFQRDELQITAKFEELFVISESNDTINLTELPQEIIVLDFWNTACRVCYKKFPDLDKLHTKYSSDDRVGIYAVNLIMKNQETKAAQERINSLNYSFPNLFTSPEQVVNIKRTFSFNVVPTIVIIKGNRVLYKGSLNIEKHIVVNNVITIVDDALREP